MGWAWADHAKNTAGAPGHEHDEHGYDAGGATNGTNQIGELCAVLEALRAHPGSESLLIETDSQYAINCSTKWVHGWKKNGWKNSQKKPVKNAELIKAIDAELSHRPGPVKFAWVKGHAGNEGNELVDELARTYAGDCRSGARDGHLPIEGWRSLLNSEYAKGTDVPPDVQLVLDGTADAASLRKPTQPSESEFGRFPESSGEAKPAAKPAAKPTNKNKSMDNPQSKPSLAELLAEPEGVPSWADDAPETTGPHAGAASQRDDAPASAMPQTTDTPAIAVSQATSYPGNLDGNPGNPSSPSGPGNPSGNTSGPGNPSSPSGPGNPSGNTSGPGNPSGLTVSGTLTFSPAPKTSPYFNGQPMPITGMLTVKGYVDGDGNLVIDNVPFIRQ
jgi:ribonuclease HI